MTRHAESPTIALIARMNAHVPCILVAALVALPTALPGQGLSEETGRRLRVTLVGQPEKSLVGTSLGLRDGTLYLRPASHHRDEPDTLAIPQASISRVDFSDGTRRHVLAGLLIGGAAGAAVGAGTFGSGPPCNSSLPRNNVFNFGCGDSFAAAGALLGGIAGLFGGALVGALIRTERWTPITPTIVTGRSASGRTSRTVTLGIRLTL